MRKCSLCDGLEGTDALAKRQVGSWHHSWMKRGCNGRHQEEEEEEERRGK